MKKELINALASSIEEEVARHILKGREEEMLADLSVRPANLLLKAHRQYLKELTNTDYEAAADQAEERMKEIGLPVASVRYVGDTFVVKFVNVPTQPRRSS